MGNKFGFTISAPRGLDLDATQLDLANELLERVPSLNRCIGCGACTATCSAGSFTEFNIRRMQTLFRRGQLERLEQQLRACMLCGKCLLVCPRGINTRQMIVEMRRMLGPKEEHAMILPPKVVRDEMKGKAKQTENDTYKPQQ